VFVSGEYNDPRLQNLCFPRVGISRGTVDYMSPGMPWLLWAWGRKAALIPATESGCWWGCAASRMHATRPNKDARKIDLRHTYRRTGDSEIPN